MKEVQGWGGLKGRLGHVLFRSSLLKVLGPWRGGFRAPEGPMPMAWALIVQPGRREKVHEQSH